MSEKVVPLRGSMAQTDASLQRAELYARLAAILRRGLTQRVGDSITVHFKTRPEADLCGDLLKANTRRKRKG